MKKMLVLLCLLLMLLPGAAWGTDSTWSTLDLQREAIAKNMPQLKQADGSFQIFGGDSARSHFAPENISIDIEKPFVRNLVNTIFHHKDYQDIQTLLEDYHRIYFSSLASGSWRLFDRAHFTGEDIYEEVNARTLTMMFITAGESEKMGDSVFSYRLDTCKINGDLCKILLTRHAEAGCLNKGQEAVMVMEDAVREGFLLEKVDGDWKIANILFDTSETFDGEPERIFNDSYTDVNMLNLFEAANDPDTWLNGFSFDVCQRGMYSPFGNYRSYVVGDFSSPQFDYEKLWKEQRYPQAAIDAWRAQQGTLVEQEEE